MKVCRIHRNGAVDLKGWSSINDKLDNNDIHTIRDNLFSGNSAKVATSIPDPFARMYLFETAFKMVNSDGSPIGRSLYHTLVSDCFDVFQLLYMMGDGERVTFRKWNVASEIANLNSSGNLTVGGIQVVHPHKILGEALEMAIKSQRFAGFNDVYLIFYQGVLIGGTSPLTVFFTSPNLSRDIIRMGVDFPSTSTTDKLFDPSPTSLQDRAEDFAEYIYKFWIANREELARKCPHFEEYIRVNGGNDYRNKLTIKGLNYSNTDFRSDFLPIFIDRLRTQHLFSGSFSINQIDPENIKRVIENNSGFVIKPSVYYYKEYKDEHGQKTELSTPLALSSQMNNRFRYVHDAWDDSITVDYLPYVPLHKKTLPGKPDIVYPYLTVNDFLEDKLIKMPFNLNKEGFFTGFEGKFEYLLPIKKEYFNYFTKQDLKQYLTIENEHSEVRIDLKIPLKTGNSIIFRKVYKKTGHDSDIWSEMVGSNSLGFGIGIFPFYRVIDKVDLNEYVIMLADNLDKSKVDLSFYAIPGIIDRRQLIAAKSVRAEKSNESGGNTFYQLKKNPDNAFDIIEVNYQGQNGLIIPIFNQLQYNTHHEHFNFAIDFGTSNSHVAYCSITNPRIEAFNIGLKELQMVMLSERMVDLPNIDHSFAYGVGRLPEIETLKNRNFVPNVIGNSSRITYPIRTVTCENKSFATSDIDLFGNVNIGYNFDIEEKKLSNTIYYTNIKWGIENKPDGKVEINRVEAFYLQTLWMIKNKILMNHGKLDANITWFVPISMKQNTKGTFKHLWEKAIRQVFGEDNKIKLSLETESTAPYYYLQSALGLFKGEDAVNVDIGGGTVDILFYAKSVNKNYSTSFKFGANTIWGDGITHHHNAASPKDNGFFGLLKKKIDSGELKITNQDIRIYYDTFCNNPMYNSADIISFLFKHDEEFKFSHSIKNHDVRILLFLHYSAIIYHIAQILLKKDIGVPKYINFTGKGSEYIRLILTDDSEITSYTGMLLKKFTKKDLPRIFEVKIAKNPKEITANGGISKIITEGEKIEPEELIYFGYDTTRINSLDHDNIEFKDLHKISDLIIENINELLDILITDVDLKRFYSKYSLSMKLGEEDLKDKVNKYLKPSLNQVIEEEMKGGNLTDIVEETPFFWALRDVFYRISKEIV